MVIGCGGRVGVGGERGACFGGWVCTFGWGRWYTLCIGGRAWHAETIAAWSILQNAHTGLLATKLRPTAEPPEETDQTERPSG